MRGDPSLRAALILAVVSVAAAPASRAADGGTMLELLKVLRDNGTISPQAYEVLRRTAQAESAQARKEIEEQVESASADQVEVNTRGKLEVNSPGEDFKVQLGGKVQVDGALYDDDRADLGSGTEIRRARLFMKGTMWRLWDYKLQYDFTGTGIGGIRDAYISYTGWRPAKVTFGHFKEPFSLENMTSDKYVTFIERSLNNTLNTGRNLGLGVDTHGASWSAHASLTGTGVDRTGSGPGGEVDEGWGVAGRATWAPWHEKTRVLHLGFGATWRDTGQAEGLRFRERPESHVTDTRLVDTGAGTISADSFTRLGAEAALVHGPFSLQGEYVRVNVDRTSGGADPAFDGWYVEGSWFLTGESRNYSVSKGAFGRVKPNSNLGGGGIGAWQAALRFSSLDLGDEDVDGGREHDLTVGLNWKPTPNIRFMANYIRVLDVEGGPHPGDEPGVFTIRGQVDF